MSDGSPASLWPMDLRHPEGMTRVRTFPLLALTLLNLAVAARVPTVWIDMAQTPGPQFLWLPGGIDGVQFQGAVQVRGGWDVLSGGWQTQHQVTRGRGVQATPEQSRLARETGGRVMLVVQAPANLKGQSCVKGLQGQSWVKTLCLRAVPGGRGNAPEYVGR